MCAGFAIAGLSWAGRSKKSYPLYEHEKITHTENYPIPISEINIT